MTVSSCCQPCQPCQTCSLSHLGCKLSNTFSTCHAVAIVSSRKRMVWAQRCQSNLCSLHTYPPHSIASKDNKLRPTTNVCRQNSQLIYNQVMYARLEIPTLHNWRSKFFFFTYAINCPLNCGLMCVVYASSLVATASFVQSKQEELTDISLHIDSCIIWRHWKGKWAGSSPRKLL